MGNPPLPIPYEAACMLSSVSAGRNTQPCGRHRKPYAMIAMPENWSVQIKRIYTPYEETDGFRVLVDRLWPRGMSKEAALLDCWAKDLAPTDSLRRWFGHQPAKFEEFRRLYLEELDGNSSINEDLCQMVAHPVVTLLYAASDTTCNHAVVLQDFLIRHRSES